MDYDDIRSMFPEFDKLPMFQSEEDGCFYFYDEKQETWKKICDIESPTELP